MSSCTHLLHMSNKSYGHTSTVNFITSAGMPWFLELSCLEGIQRLHQLFFTKRWNYAYFAYIHVFLNLQIYGEKWTHDSFGLLRGSVARAPNLHIMILQPSLHGSVPTSSVRIFHLADVLAPIALTSSFFTSLGLYCAIRVGPSGLLRAVSS